MTSKKLQGITNRQTHIFSPKKTLKRVPFLDENDTSQIEPYNEIQEQNMFEKPEVYVVKDHMPPRGYFMVKQRSTNNPPFKYSEIDETSNNDIEDHREVEKPIESESRIEENSHSNKYNKLQSKFRVI